MQPDEQPVEIRDLYESLFREKEYTQYEMDSIIPGYDYEDMDSDPICIAIDLKNEGNKSEAIDILLKLLEKDFRCIDAYSHLGNFHMPDDENSFYLRIGGPTLTGGVTTLGWVFQTNVTFVGFQSP